MLDLWGIRHVTVTFLVYIQRVKLMGKSQEVFASFFSVTTSTIARWLEDILNFSEIDTSLFKRILSDMLLLLLRHLGVVLFKILWHRNSIFCAKKLLQVLFKESISGSN